jgi:cellulose synthase/poly-beta-1,6-N-acetylglucosamine synthase-like glycosyltransferase
MPKPEASLILSVYTNTVFLKAVLDSLKEQTWNDFEIIVSEDGESAEMKAFLESYSFEHPWKHLTQPDLGWRKNEALNRAITASSTDHLVFVDGDCLLHPAFMEMHHRYYRPDRVLAGKRIKMNPDISQSLLEGDLTLKNLDKYLINHYLQLKKMGFLFPEEGLFIHPDGLLGVLPKLREMSQLKGCNMSFPKDVLLKINGFDEDYKQPAIGEDIDLVWRLQRAGFHLFSLRNLAVQYHLYHSESWSDQSENIRMMERKEQAGLFHCLNGIKKS